MKFKRIQKDTEACAGDILIINSYGKSEDDYYLLSENDNQPDENGVDSVIFTDLSSGISYVRLFPSSLPIKKGVDIDDLGVVIEVISQNNIEFTF